MRTICGKVLLTAALAALMTGCSSGNKKPVIMLDSGHDLQEPGYTSRDDELSLSFVDYTEGAENAGLITEAAYDEALTAELESLLKATGQFTVIRTKTADESMTMAGRLERIDKEEPDLVISIHAIHTMETGATVPLICVEPAGSETHDASLAAGTALQARLHPAEKESQLVYCYYTPVRPETWQLHIVPADDTTDYGEETLEIMTGNSAPVVQISLLSLHSHEDLAALAAPEGIRQTAEMLRDGLTDYFAQQN